MVMPFGNRGSVPEESRTKSGSAERRKPENCSCNPKEGPGSWTSSPGGYLVWARKPTVRVETANELFENPTAVRPFWTATSQLNKVASPVRNAPRTVGPTLGSFGLFSTVIKTC